LFEHVQRHSLVQWSLGIMSAGQTWDVISRIAKVDWRLNFEARFPKRQGWLQRPKYLTNLLPNHWSGYAKSTKLIDWWLAKSARPGSPFNCTVND
jgi:hypothetical protein